jgi:hypothetical protein
MHTPGIEGQCPRCMAQLMVRPGGWRGLADLGNEPQDDIRGLVYHCVMCGHYEDDTVRANKLGQHTTVTEGVTA